MILFQNGSRKSIDHTCTTPAPDIFSCPPIEQCHVEECCEPKTYVKNAIKMQYNETERKIYLMENGCSLSQIPILMKCIKMVVRKRGFCKTLFELEPYKLDLDGSVYFAWGQQFLQTGKGLYEADIFIDCKLVNTLLFYKPEYRGVVVTEAVTFDPCTNGNTPCDSSCNCGCASCGSIPTIDIEYNNIVTEPNCGDCNAGCN